MCKNCVKGMDFNSFKAVLIKKGEEYNFQASVLLWMLFNAGGDLSILSAVDRSAIISGRQSGQ